MPHSLRLRRLGYRVAYRALRLQWFILRPRVRGVKCILIDSGRVLLVRHTYGRRAWDLPGGGVRRHESPASAAEREMREELGLTGVSWREIGSFNGDVDRRRDTIHCFTVELAAPALRFDQGELAAARWFEPRRLPAQLGPYVAPAMALLDAADEPR